jgi:hypothetical protein
MAAAMFTQIAQVLQLVVEIGQQPLDPGQEVRAHLAELDAAGGAIEQSHLQRVLKLPHGLAQCRLGHAEPACGTAEAAGLHNLDKGLELPKIDIH